MGKQIPLSTSAVIAGKEFTLETGKLAALTDGSVVLRYGDTMLLATAVAAEEARPDQSFFPLSVDYREKFASAGRIPGNFFRREARPSEYEILTSRLVDRAIRPLFPDHFLNETQIFIFLISADGETLPDAFAAFAASAALMVSDIPFAGPISEVRIARINGEFIVNPSRTELETADMEFIIAGSMDNIVMVEGEADECQEEDLIEAIKVAHEAIKEQCKMQLELRQLKGVTENRPVAEKEENEELKAAVDSACREKLMDIAGNPSDKKARKNAFKALKDETKAALTEQFGEEAWGEMSHLFSGYFDALKKECAREVVLSKQQRLDGRTPTEVRNIWCEVDYLPAPHGSALFTRGETQSLTTVTLGSKMDEALIDTALSLHNDNFLLHYNFPPFSVNEVGRPRGTSRREVGHGHLARRSLARVMPKDYPYTVRIVSDILESNGSSSMATVCAGSLGLMDAGVPIRKPVSGIAMGLITDGKGRSVVLTDILGDEDHLGDMDFKVTGTEDGICAVQMDIKIDGLDYELLRTALLQAREGRLHILGVMNETMSEAREDLKPQTPRMELIIIDADYIGAVIGSGGKVIQGLQKETNTVVTVNEEDGKGYVHISGDKPNVDKAAAFIHGITTEPEVGEIYDAKIVKLMPYGAFIEFLPGREGLLHVSELAWERIENVEEVLTEGEEIQVKLLEIDPRTGKFRLSRKVLLEKPEGYVERPPRENRDRNDDRRGGGRGGDRGGRGGDRGGRNNRR